MFGTIHALPDNADWRTPALDAVLAQTDMLMVEIAELGDRGKAVEAFETRAYDMNLAPILNRVPSDRRAELAVALDIAGIDPDALIHTETWAAALQLSNSLRCSNSENGVDRALLAEFPNAQSLESHARQFDAFDSLPGEAQVDLLLSVAAERDCSGGEERIEAWLTGDIETLESSILAGFRGNPALREGLVDARNRHYAAQIVRYQALKPEMDLLVAVGAGHMFGESGLPALLTARGYSVRRIQ